MCDTMTDLYRDASTTPPRAAERCELCRFWRPSPDRAGQCPGTPGRCYKYAPAVGGGFPSVDAAEWCGEFQQRASTK